jgi:tetratricopeptide (TPR) repeat protein
MQKISRVAVPDLLYILALLAFGLIAYSNSFTAAFQYDDGLHILRNKTLVDLTNVSRIYHYCPERFLVYLTLAINYKIGKFDPISYHTFNFFIHYIAALFLYFLFLEIWKTPAMAEIGLKFSKRVGAFLAAGIFFLHPLQTESVTYVIQRAESMAGMFYLAALFFYVKARTAQTRNSLFGYSLLAGLGALGAAFSKEIAVTLPVMIVIFELFFFETSIKGLLQNKLFLFFLIPAVLILVPKLKNLVQNDFFYDRGPGMTSSREQYILTQFSVLITYLRLFFWPAGQNIDWDYTLATNFFALETVSSLLLLLLLLVLAYFSYRSLRLLSLGLVAFFVTLAPTSSIIPLRHVIFEHRMYLAVAFLAMACVHLFSFGLERIKHKSHRAHPLVLFIMVTVLLSLLSGVTQARNQVWLSELSLWEDAVKKSPNKASAHINYGRSLNLLSNRVTEQGKRAFETALKLSPSLPVPYHNLALYYFQQGDYQQAIGLDLEAIERWPAYKEALYQLGRSYSKLNQWHKARLYLERLVGLAPGSRFIQARLVLLEVYLNMGLRAEAIDLAQGIIQMSNGMASLDYYRGVAFYKLSDMVTAKFYFQQQIETESKRLPSYLMLGKIHYLEKEYKQAEIAFRQALEQDKWSAQAHYNLALLLEKDGRFQDATEHFEEVLAVDPFTIDTSARLVSLYTRLENSAKRTERLRKLFGLKPGSVEYAYLKENQNEELSETLRAYEEKFISIDGSPPSMKAKAIISTLIKDYQEAVAQYDSYLETLTSEFEKKNITKEVHRLEELLQGKEPSLRTPV